MRRWHSIPSLVRFGQVPGPMKKTYFLKFLIREIRVYSRISVWKPNFFPTQATSKILVVSESRCAGDTPHRVLLDLDKSLIRWKRPVLKFVIREIRKFPYEILTFFLHKLHQKILLFQTLGAQVILHTKCGLIWKSPWPDEQDLFFEVPYSRNSCIFANFRMKT